MAICACFSVVLGCSVYDLNPTYGADTYDAPAISYYRQNDASITYRQSDASNSNTIVSTSSDVSFTTGEETCGDGRVTGTELCDTAIAPGLAGACPTQCATTIACMTSELRGAGCYTVCVLSERTCQSGDGCCPASCSAATDTDCSANCGDGVVQSDGGELCEPVSAAVKAQNPSAACPTQCPDDGDSCTKETLVGTSANCNAHCTRTPITAFVPGDGCCPHGANANQDSDCKPVCGNGVVESGEQCDGSANCDSQCKFASVSTATAFTCAGRLKGVTGDCLYCLCSKCAEQTEACYDSGDTERDARCASVVNCGLQADCEGDACYCGYGNVSAFGTCLTFAAYGACRQEIETAAGTVDMLLILGQKDDLDTAVGLATAFTRCHVAQCQGC